MYGQHHEPSAYFCILAAMPNQHNLQVISRSAQRKDECPVRGMQVPRNRIGINTCIKEPYQKGHELNCESNMTQVTKISTTGIARISIRNDSLEEIDFLKTRRAKKDERRVARTIQETFRAKSETYAKVVLKKSFSEPKSAPKFA